MVRYLGELVNAIAYGLFLVSHCILCSSPIDSVDMQLNNSTGGDGGEGIETFAGEKSVGGGRYVWGLHFIWKLGRFAVGCNANLWLHVFVSLQVCQWLAKRLLGYVTALPSTTGTCRYHLQLFTLSSHYARLAMTTRGQSSLLCWKIVAKHVGTLTQE